MKVNIVIIPTTQGEMKVRDLLVGLNVPINNEKELNELRRFLMAGVEAYEDWRVCYETEYV